MGSHDGPPRVPMTPVQQRHCATCALARDEHEDGWMRTGCLLMQGENSPANVREWRTENLNSRQEGEPPCPGYVN